MRHQDGHGHVLEKMARGPSQHQLPQPGVAIGAADDEVGADIGRVGEKHVTHRDVGAASLGGGRVDAVTGEVERRTEYVYAQLLAALESRGLRVNAPFFHVFPDDGSAYATVYLGYAEPPEA